MGPHPCPRCGTKTVDDPTSDTLTCPDSGWHGRAEDVVGDKSEQTDWNLLKGGF